MLSSSEEHVLFNPSLEIGDRVASGGDVMPGAGDPEIRLFGLEIPLQDCQGVAEPTGAGERSSMGKRNEMIKSLQAKNSEDEVLATEKLDRPKRSISSGLNNCDDDAHRITTSDAGTSEQKHEQDNPEATLGQDKVLKKPDKILPCPRCNSLATKFCYYNNYNVNQPRHFCKKCQRYWTAGGSLRNLPVGSGKRKNKSFASHHCHVVIPSDGLAGNRTDSPNPVIYPLQPVSFSGHLPVKDLKTNSTASKFESEGPLSESMSSVLNLGDKNNATMATLHCHDKNEAGSCSSSTTISNCVENDHLEVALGMEKNSIHASSNSINLPYNFLCFPTPPWPYTWPVGWNNMASMMSGYCSSELVYSQTNGSPNPVPWPPQALASPMHSPLTPFLYPATNWSHIPSWPKAMWNLPSVYMSEHGYSINNSPTLGKHSRDDISEAEDKTEKILWIPKTLRIDDPDEAAKSSIWATLGITPGKSSKSGAIFETLRSNSERNQTPDAARVLQANPAAIARSQKLQESA